MILANFGNCVKLIDRIATFNHLFRKDKTVNITLEIIFRRQKNTFFTEQRHNNRRFIGIKRETRVSFCETEKNH